MLKSFLKFTLMLGVSGLCSLGAMAQTTSPKCQALAEGADLQNLDNLTAAFQYMECITNCTYSSNLLQPLLDQYLGKNKTFDLTNVTVEMPFSTSESFALDIINVSISATIPIRVNQLAIVSPGEIDIATCSSSGKAVTFRNSNFSGNIYVNLPVPVKGTFEKISLIKGDVSLTATVPVSFSLETSMTQNPDGTITIQGFVPPATVVLGQPNLKCQNNLSQDAAGVAAVVGQANALAAAATGGAAFIVTVPAITIGFPIALEGFLKNSVCPKIQDKFKAFVNKEFIANQLNQKVATVFGAKICSIAGFGLSCSSIK